MTNAPHSPGSPTAPPTGTALVLGGGGSAGNAWLVGMLAGLHEGGVDVTAADLVVGTSAGSTAAAQVTAADPSRLLADILDAAPVDPAARPAPRPIRSGGATHEHLERMRRTIAESTDLADFRRRMGRIALDLPASSDPAAQGRWRSVVAARLPSDRWPDRRMLVTAVDARTGDPVVLDRDSGVDLVDAVAASCAGGFAYWVGERPLIDGGYRANADNADIAAGYARVIVLSPLGARSMHPPAWGSHLDVQVARMQAAGARVEVIVPDEAALAAFGDDMMDPSTRTPAARAAHAHGLAISADLGASWAGR